MANLQHYPDDCLEFIDHPSHARPGIHVLHDRLYVITTLFNPLRFRSRYWNFNLFDQMVSGSGAILYVVEIAFGNREFEITNPYNPNHLQLRARDNQELWLKENSLNLLIERLPPEAKYIAWIDADIQFVRPDWAQETMQLLQHYKFLQMFSHAQDVGINYEPMIMTPGYAFSKSQENNGINKPNEETTGIDVIENYYTYYYCVEKPGKEVGWKYRHPGFCWAARRDALNEVGGLIDWTILGSGDWIMATALYGEVDKSLNINYTENYKKLCHIWQDRADRYIRRNVGYMPGTVIHHYHGEKKARNYDTRWKLLVDTQFDPLIDLKKDTQGLYQLVDHGDERSIQIRDGLRTYARLRNEDINTGTVVP